MKVCVDSPTKLDLGCGAHKRPGFTGVDVADLFGVQRVDLLRFPWPWASASIDEVHCSHFFEHVPGKLRGAWMDELWRVMKVGAHATIVVPAWNSPGAVQDFTHEWPPVCPESFAYFNKAMREAMGVEHYGVRCDFDFNASFADYPIPQSFIDLVKREGAAA